MRTASLLCAALVCLAPAARAQDNRDAAFKAGLDARDDKKWQEVATHMQRAIEADPRENPRKVSRGFGRLLGTGNEYLPYYFLGEALFNLGQCAGAVEAWAASDAQGVIKVRGDYAAAVVKGYEACEAKGVLPPGKFDPLVARTRQHLTNVSNQAGAISDRGKVHLELWRSDATLREEYERATAELQAARARLAAASRTRAERDFTDAVAAADRARAILAGLGARFDKAVAARSTAETLAREVEGALQAAHDLERAVDGKKPFLTQALAATRQAASDALGRARAQLTAGKGDANMAQLNEARTVALEATARFRDVLEEIARIEKRLLAERVAAAIGATQEAFSFTEGAFATLAARFVAKPTEVTPEKVAQREALQKQFEALLRRRDSATRAENVTGLQQAAQLATEIRMQVETLTSAFGPVTIIDRGVRPELAEGARLFFAGEYAQALATLDPDRLGDGPLQLHVHLFRAASHYALFVRSGGQDEAQQAQARAEVERCRQLNPAFEPDPRAFAPRFISFFQAAGAPAPQAGSPPS